MRRTSSKAKTKVSKVAKKRLNAPDQFKRLPQFLAALTELYPQDATKPGVVMSCLGHKEFYCSAVRYNRAFGQDKQVLASAKAPTANEALKETINKWLMATRHIRALLRGEA